MYYFSVKDKEKKNVDYSKLIEEPTIRFENENIGFSNLKSKNKDDMLLNEMIEIKDQISNTYLENDSILNDVNNLDVLNESILSNNTKSSKIIRLSKAAIGRSDKTLEKMKQLIKANVEDSLVSNLKSVSQVVLGLMAGLDYMTALQRSKSEKFDMDFFKELSNSYRKLLPTYNKYISTIAKFENRKSAQAIKDAKIWRTSIKTDVKRILQKETKKEMSVAGIASTTGPVINRADDVRLNEDCIEIMWDK